MKCRGPFPLTDAGPGSCGPQGQDMDIQFAAGESQADLNVLPTSSFRVVMPAFTRNQPLAAVLCKVIGRQGSVTSGSVVFVTPSFLLGLSLVLLWTSEQF